MTTPRIVPHEEWLKAGQAHLAKEKDFDAAARRAGPGAARAAVGAGREGLRLRETDGRETLPICSTAGASSSSTTSCSAPTGTKAARAARSGPTTSTASPSICAARRHLRARSRARRSPSSRPTGSGMGWTMSSGCRRSGNDFNFDFGVSFTPDEQRAAPTIYDTLQPEHPGGPAGHQRVRKGDGRRDLPHLLVPLARPRRDEPGVSPPRPRRRRAATRIPSTRCHGCAVTIATEGGSDGYGHRQQYSSTCPCIRCAARARVRRLGRTRAVCTMDVPSRGRDRGMPDRRPAGRRLAHQGPS